MEASTYLQSPTMSIVSFSNRVSIYKPSPLIRRRKDSGELDVFEAAGYFSGYTEATGGGFNGGSFKHKIVNEEREIWKGRRSISFDMRMENMVSEQCFNGGLKEVKEKKFKLSSSPGAKLASFLNSLFNQKNSKKKKMKSNDLKSMNPSSHFRLPLLFVRAPKNFMELEQKETPLKHRAKADLSEEKKKKDSALMDEKFDFRDGFSEKQKMNWRGKHEAEEKKGFNGGSVEEDGGESDSSSDLFELQISNLNHFSSNDLRVSETTKLEKIRKGI